jgi:hypothetical protein
MPADPDVTLIDDFEPVDAAKGSAFPRSAPADQCYDLPFVDVQIDPLEHLQRTVALMDSLKFNDG